jgi:hypothetical protein
LNFRGALLPRYQVAFKLLARRKEMKKPNLLLGSFVMVLAGLLGACQSSSPVVSRIVIDDPLLLEIAQIRTHRPDTFVGKVDGTDAFIAVVKLQQQVIAYVCDGTPGGVTVSKWFQGTLKDGQLNAKATDGSSLTGTLAGTTLNGSVSIADALRAFTSTDAPSPAGLWLTVGTDDFDEIANARERKLPFENLDLLRVGWIVLPDGSQRGAINKKTGTTIAEPVNTSNGNNSSGETALNLESTPTNNLAGLKFAIGTKCQRLAGTVSTYLDGSTKTPIKSLIEGAAQKAFVEWYLGGCYGTNGGIGDYL